MPAERPETRDPRQFKVMLDYDERKAGDCPGFVPWGLVAPHARQAQYNHDQSLETLHSRGGLSPQELYCTLRDESLDPIFHKTITNEHAIRYIKTRLELYEKEHNRAD